jgi:hypothetical protein
VIRTINKQVYGIEGRVVSALPAYSMKKKYNDSVWTTLGTVEGYEEIMASLLTASA